MLTQEFFVHRLRQMLWVEERLADELLPRCSEQVGSTDLKVGIERHQLETRQHVLTVRTILNQLGHTQEAIESPVLFALEADFGETDLEIADLLAKGEHFEIAAYTTLRSLANALGEEDISIRLTEILEQEQYALELVHKATAKLLAEQVANA